jgi:hypothetical protein
MKVADYLDSLPVHQVFTQHAADSYAVYNNLYPDVATFNYYRTKFNHKARQLRENSTITNTLAAVEITLPQDEPQTVNVTEVIDADLVETPMVAETMEALDSEDLDSELLPTGTYFDKLASDINEGGFTRGCVDVTVGLPGAGKSALLSLLAVDVKEQQPDVEIGYIHFEMSRKEWQRMVSKMPRLSKMNVIFMQDYSDDRKILDKLQEALLLFDIVVLDSVQAAIDFIKEATGYKATTVEQRLINMLLKTADQQNMNIQAIQQVAKDGTFKGGTKLIHMTSSLRYVVKHGSSERYIEHEKNRNNGDSVYRKLYYTLDQEACKFIFGKEDYERAYLHQQDNIRTLDDLLTIKQPMEA